MTELKSEQNIASVQLQRENICTISAMLSHTG